MPCTYRHDPHEEDCVAEQDDADRHGAGQHLQVLGLGHEWALGTQACCYFLSEINQTRIGNLFS